MNCENVNVFCFDLWREPWIGLETPAGVIEYKGIEETLLTAHQYTTLFDFSPLVVVGIHRFLTAILQDIFDPQTHEDLKRVWSLEQIPIDLIKQFGNKHRHRFDLFSVDQPFFQSAEVSPIPEKGANIKSVTYLAFDIPSGTEHTHYRHGSQDDQVLCAGCCAGGLLCLPAFATSGGAGIKPSINGVPPIYVIPTGKNLLESLVLSLVLPSYQPQIRNKDEDLVWWKRPPTIPRSSEVSAVGYLHSLTFQPRRVRLYPETIDGICTRCGSPIQFGVKKMIFDMGESRPKNAPAWFDPFAAYKVPDNKPPIPVRPIEGKALWREYSNLFLQKSQKDYGEKKGAVKTIRPRILDQLAVLRGDQETVQVRAVGLRTDMKAKIFEWVDSGFEIPSAILANEDTGYLIDKGLDFSQRIASILAYVFRKSIGGSSQSSDRYVQLKSEMFDLFWRGLAVPFRDWVLKLAKATNMQAVYREWLTLVCQQAISAFEVAASGIGDEGKQLMLRFQGERLCRQNVFAALNKEIDNE